MKSHLNYVCSYCAFEIFASMNQIMVTCPQCDESMQEI
jgi:DNA-directed RNA polymerase subunit RPC12/RpoP